MHASTGSRAVQKCDGALFKHACANPAENVILTGAVQNDVVYAGIGQELTQQEARWSAADDHDLCAHDQVFPGGPSRMMLPHSASAVRSAAPVVTVICGMTSHSSVHAEPERSCSCIMAVCMLAS